MRHSLRSTPPAALVAAGTMFALAAALSGQSGNAVTAQQMPLGEAPPRAALTGAAHTGAAHAVAAPARAAPAEGAAPRVAGHLLTRRYLYISTNFQVAANVAPLKALLTRASDAGFNGAVVADVKFGRLDDGSLIEEYYTNLRDVLTHAEANGIDLFPAVAYYGYSSPLLWHNPDLAEGLPVRDASFVVSGGRIIPDPSSAPVLANGDFESVVDGGDRFTGWAFQDEPGVATFADRDVVHGGNMSLRMTDLGRTNPSSGNGRVYQRLTVQPFKNYHASVWARTADFRGGEVRVLVLAESPSRTLQWNPVPVRPTQDWTRFDVTFNSLTHTEVLIYFGVWGGGTGSIWWDDAALAPAGLVNMIRRPGAPSSVTSVDGGTTYTEGADYSRLEDPRTGRVPYPGVYDLWHEPPEVLVPVGSRLQEGEKVLVSHYHTASIYGDQVAASLLEPESLALSADQIRAVRRHFADAIPFSGWLFSHDEIRMHGWDQAPKAGSGTPGENLAANFRTLREAARAAEPDADVLVWSDMFDPFHNASETSDAYYLVNGNWSGSWLGLDPDVIVANWNHGASRRPSAEFFAGRGHRQILAGYYDSPPDEFSDRLWLEELEGVAGIEGVMYTPWSSGYDNLEAWALHVWGDAPWVDPRPLGSSVHLPVVRTE